MIAAKASQLVLKGDYPGALQLYDLGSKIEPDNAAFALGRAEALYKTGRRAEAEAILSGSREKAKTGPQYLGLCWAEARAGMFLETALRDCNKARELDSNTKSAIRALVLLRLGRIAEAEEAFSTAIKENHSAFNYMGRAFAGHRRGDRAKAEADRAEALRLDPDEELQFAEYGLEFDAPSASAAAAH